MPSHTHKGTRVFFLEVTIGLHAFTYINVSQEWAKPIRKTGPKDVEGSYLCSKDRVLGRRICFVILRTESWSFESKVIFRDPSICKSCFVILRRLDLSFEGSLCFTLTSSHIWQVSQIQPNNQTINNFMAINTWSCNKYEIEILEIWVVTGRMRTFNINN